MNDAVFRNASADKRTDFEARRVAVGQYDYAACLSEAFYQLLLLFVLENAEAVGLYYNGIEDCGEFYFIILSSTMTACFIFIILPSTPSGVYFRDCIATNSLTSSSSITILLSTAELLSSVSALCSSSRHWRRTRTLRADAWRETFVNLNCAAVV